jgi:hypothetical protein
MPNHLENMGAQVKSLAPTPITPLIEEYKSLEDKITWFDYKPKGRQCAVQYNPEDPDMWMSGVGRLTVPDERVYSKLNPLFEGTLIGKLVQQYSMFRARLMWVGPKTCYSMHKDKTRRIHIPIITNPASYLVLADFPPVHIFAGYAWGVDTRLYHTVMNCSDEPRLHLVGVVYN